MDDDDPSDLFSAFMDMGASQAPIASCVTCGSTNFIVEDNGEPVCLDCGTQSHDVRTLTQEEFTGGGVMRYRSGGGHVRKTPKQQQASLVPSTIRAFNVQDFLRASQSIILRQATTLIEQCGAPAGLVNVLRTVWLRYLSKWSHSPSPIVHVIDGRLYTSSERMYLVREAAEGHQPPPIVPFSMLTLLSMVYLSCRWMQLPYLSYDIAHWVENGSLLYLNAYSSLHYDLQVILKLASSFFIPSLPTSDQIERTANALAFNLGIGVFDHSDSWLSPPLDQLKRLGLLPCALPALNIPLILLRTISLLGMPSEVYPLAIEVHTLYLLDDASTHNVPISSPLHSTNSVDPVARLKRRITLERVNPGAYIAALLAVAIRLVPGWEVWTDNHLAPGVTGTKCQQFMREGLPQLAKVASECERPGNENDDAKLGESNKWKDDSDAFPMVEYTEDTASLSIATGTSARSTDERKEASIALPSHTCNSGLRFADTLLSATVPYSVLSRIQTSKIFAAWFPVTLFTPVSKPPSNAKPQGSPVKTHLVAEGGILPVSCLEKSDARGTKNPSLDPSALLRSYLALLRTKILAGGEVGIGRAAAVESDRPVYNAEVSVQIRDKETYYKVTNTEDVAELNAELVSEVGDADLVAFFTGTQMNSQPEPRKILSFEDSEEPSSSTSQGLFSQFLASHRQSQPSACSSQLEAAVFSNAQNITSSNSTTTSRDWDDSNPSQILSVPNSTSRSAMARILDPVTPILAQLRSFFLPDSLSASSSAAIAASTNSTETASVIKDPSSTPQKPKHAHIPMSSPTLSTSHSPQSPASPFLLFSQTQKSPNAKHTSHNTQVMPGTTPQFASPSGKRPRLTLSQHDAWYRYDEDAPIVTISDTPEIVRRKKLKGNLSDGRNGVHGTQSSGFDVTLKLGPRSSNWGYQQVSTGGGLWTVPRLREIAHQAEVLKNMFKKEESERNAEVHFELHDRSHANGSSEEGLEKNRKTSECRPLYAQHKLSILPAVLFGFTCQSDTMYGFNAMESPAAYLDSFRRIISDRVSSANAQNGGPKGNWAKETPAFTKWTVPAAVAALIEDADRPILRRCDFTALETVIVDIRQDAIVSMLCKSLRSHKQHVLLIMETIQLVLRLHIGDCT